MSANNDRPEIAGNEPDLRHRLKHAQSSLALRVPFQGFRDRFLRKPTLGAGGWTLLEILVVLIWTVIVTRPYQDMNPSLAPAGREFLSAIQTHQVWENAKSCGDCAFWFGAVRGGMPSFVDPVASVLHPLVILCTSIWGVINGAKMSLVGIFLVAGLSQWWLGYILGLRRLVRVWAASLSVVGAYLAARMGLGAFSLVLSTGSAVMIFPALVGLARNWSRKWVVVLALALAIIAVGGTGYIQVGLVFTLPAAILLAVWNRQGLMLALRRYAQALGLAILFAGPFLVPFLHFMPNIHKDFDPSFASAQPFQYTPLNLVIRDMDYYMTEVLGKPNWPAHFANYIGWVPVILAVWCMFRPKDQAERRVVYFLGAAAVLALWTSSAGPLAWLVKVINSESITGWLSGVRYTSFMSSLAIPPVLGLAAIGLDRLLDAWNRRFRISLESNSKTSFGLNLDLRWLLVIPLLVTTNQNREFTSQWIKTSPIAPSVYRVLDALQTDGLQWVNLPLGEHFFVTPAMDTGLKIGNDFFRTWHWIDHQPPTAYLEANRGEPPEGMQEVEVIEGVHIHAASDGYEYAVVMESDGAVTPCRASGVGGDITVVCNTGHAGNLVVQENHWSGWRAEVDGQATPLRGGNRLSVDAPAGEHTYRFRYKPWDVPVGIAAFVLGIIVSLWFVFGQKRDAQQPSPMP